MLPHLRRAGLHTASKMGLPQPVQWHTAATDDLQVETASGAVRIRERYQEPVEAFRHTSPYNSSLPGGCRPEASHRKYANRDGQLQCE